MRGARLKSTQRGQKYLELCVRRNKYTAPLGHCWVPATLRDDGVYVYQAASGDYMNGQTQELTLDDADGDTERNLITEMEAGHAG